MWFQNIYDYRGSISKALKGVREQTNKQADRGYNFIIVDYSNRGTRFGFRGMQKESEAEGPFLPKQQKR